MVILDLYFKTNILFVLALFSNNDEFREDAHNRLNEKIAEYNRMLKRSQPLQESRILSSDSLTNIIDDAF
jgi:hypothetical protein